MNTAYLAAHQFVLLLLICLVWFHHAQKAFPSDEHTFIQPAWICFHCSLPVEQDDGCSCSLSYAEHSHPVIQFRKGFLSSYLLKCTIQNVLNCVLLLFLRLIAICDTCSVMGSFELYVNMLTFVSTDTLCWPPQLASWTTKRPDGNTQEAKSLDSFSKM